MGDPQDCDPIPVIVGVQEETKVDASESRVKVVFGERERVVEIGKGSSPPSSMRLGKVSSRSESTRFPDERGVPGPIGRR